MKDAISDSISAFPPVGACGTEAIIDPSSSGQANGFSKQPATSGLAGAITALRSTRRANLPFVEYSPLGGSWTLTGPCPESRPLPFRVAAFDAGELFEVVWYSPHSHCDAGHCFPVLFLRNVGGLGANRFSSCCNLEVVVFEYDSYLGGIVGRAFFLWASLESISIPSFVDVLGEDCFSGCTSLHSLIFERPSRLARIAGSALRGGVVNDLLADFAVGSAV
jgi:hypothetical protein